MCVINTYFNTRHSYGLINAYFPSKTICDGLEKEIYTSTQCLFQGTLFEYVSFGSGFVHLYYASNPHANTRQHTKHLYVMLTAYNVNPPRRTVQSNVCERTFKDCSWKYTRLLGMVRNNDASTTCIVNSVKYDVDFCNANILSHTFMRKIYRHNKAYSHTDYSIKLELPNTSTRWGTYLPRAFSGDLKQHLIELL